MSNVVNASFDPARFEITVGRISLVQQNVTDPAGSVLENRGNHAGEAGTRCQSEPRTPNQPIAPRKYRSYGMLMRSTPTILRNRGARFSTEAKLSAKTTHFTAARTYRCAITPFWWLTFDYPQTPTIKHSWTRAFSMSKGLSSFNGDVRFLLIISSAFRAASVIPNQTLVFLQILTSCLSS